MLRQPARRCTQSYEAIEWPASGERLNEQTFHQYRQQYPEAHVIFHMIPEYAMDLAVSYPSVMIASAGIAHVLVGGTPVVLDGKLRQDVFPGRGVLNGRVGNDDVIEE